MNGSRTLRFGVFALPTVVMLAALPSPGVAQGLTAVVIEAAGRVAVRRTGSSDLIPVQVNVTRLTGGDMIITSRNSRATLRVDGKLGAGDAEHPAETTLQIGPQTRVLMSQLYVDATNGNEEIQIAVGEGQVIANVRRINPESERFEVDTPTAIAAVRGTRFATGVLWKNRKPEVTFAVEKGRIELFNRGGGRLAQLKAGDKADIDSSGTVTLGAAAQAQGPTAAQTLIGGRGPGGSGVSGGEDTDTTTSSIGDDERDDTGGER